MNYTEIIPQSNDKSMTELEYFAVEYVRSGLPIVIEKNKKPPMIGYSEFRERLPEESEIGSWFKKYPDCNGIGILTGTFSKVEVIDIDVKNDPKRTICTDFEKAVGPLFYDLGIEETPSGGLHVFYRCSEIGKKEDLAFSEEGKPIIELLGEGAKCTCYPTSGYELVGKSWTEIPTITPEERSHLLSVARSFNKKTEQYTDNSEYSLAREYQSVGLTPWSDYNTRGDPLGLLIRHGWRQIGASGHNVYLAHPEKKEKENSATWNSEKRLLFVWTHKTIFQAGKAYNPSALYAFLECQGDFREMARRLSEEGFGDRLPSKSAMAPPQLPIIKTEPEKIELEPTSTKKKNIPLDLERIHPLFREYARYSEGTEIYREFMLSSFLVSLGVLTGNKVYRLSGASKIRPNLYMCLIGDSGWGKKSSSLEYGLKGLREINKALAEEYNQKRELYEEDQKDKARKATSEEPIDDRYIYPNEFSVASFVKKLQGRPHGLFVTGEMGEVLAKMQSPSALGFKETVTDLYECFGGYSKELNSYNVYIDDPAPSWIGASTLPWLQKYISQEDLFTGFLGRFIFVIREEFPEKPQAEPRKLILDPMWETIFKGLQNFSGELNNSPEASEIWRVWYEKNFYEAQKEDKFKSSSLARYLRICEKIAIINHAIDATLENVKNPYEIEAVSYERAFPWIDFFLKNLEACYTQLSAKPDYNELKVLETVRKKGKNEGGYIVASRSIVITYANLNKKQAEEIEGTLELKNQLQVIRQGKYVYYRIRS